MRSLWIGATGLRASSLWLDTVADNLANVNTAGFRRRRLELAPAAGPSWHRAVQAVPQVPPPVSPGVVAAATSLDGRPGAWEATGDPLHLAIEGDGWFRVREPGGAVLLTRDGGFRLDGQRRVVTAGGALLLDERDRPVTMPEWAERLTVAPDGRVEAHGGDRVEAVAQLALARVTNPSGLLAMGDNLFSPSPASGPAEVVRPGTGGAGTLRAGVLERSNVDLAEEMVDLLLAQRLFQLNARVVQSADELMGLVNRLRG